MSSISMTVLAFSDCNRNRYDKTPLGETLEDSVTDSMIVCACFSCRCKGSGGIAGSGCVISSMSPSRLRASEFTGNNVGDGGTECSGVSNAKCLLGRLAVISCEAWKKTDSRLKKIISTTDFDSYGVEHEMGPSDLKVWQIQGLNTLSKPVTLRLERIIMPVNCD